uniref:Uncharacterized protein LOC113788765 n=1 Tax=Dermatophagoides pteronyssinus TaxID=6956 RepID=A0A6P6XKU9_DERPT|nr:uncharacterized protein LOC113788765 [Dermatophagoides pteronyssinus]XP_027194018.1 uncharacterized protein LOC113788765 [Dermatophagoides pteronyssinus]XP_027194019.1 uncharacterized protein LOC113788765 [Dermatophagoides pteronyssinus]
MSSSIRSLQRIGSFRGRFISSKNKLNKRNEYDDDNDDDDDDIDHDDDNNDDIDPIVGRKSTFCRYTEIYRRIILNDNLDLLVRPKNQHPKIIKNSRKRSNETTFVTKNCSGCNEMGSVLIIGSINDLLFHNLIGYLKNSNERLEKLTIQLDGTNIIDDSLRSFELFSKSVGNNIRSIRLVADYKDLSTAFMFNNSISTTLLQMLYLNNGYFTNLVEFEVLLSDNAILHYFEKFWCEFGNTIQRLTIKIRHDLHKFNEFALNILKLLLPPERLNDNDEENRERIRSIHFELIPISNQAITNKKIDLNQVLHAIGCLSRVFRTVITNVNLVVDINFVRQPLHLIECLAEFKLAETFQLTIHDNPNRLNFATNKNRSTTATKLQLNFEILSTIKNLHHFYIDYSGLTNDDVETLSRHCSNLQSLYIGCDKRIEKQAIYSIGKYLGRLQTLSIAPAFNYEYERYGLNINNEALIQLFTHIQMGSPIELSRGLAFLRTLRLVNCRIRIDKIQHQVSFEYPKQPETKSQDLIQYLRNVGASLPTNEKFTLILENNRYPLPEEKSFHKEFNIPTNIKVFWYYRKLKHETRI